MAGPLQHLRVVEAATVMPGAIAGMLLADHGAEVIKVEPRGGAFFAHDLTRKGWDRGKASVELDLASGTLRGLLRTADIFIHSLTPAEAAAQGLDEASLARDFPALVSCSLSAYGRDTPLADRPYGEALVAAQLGTMIDKGSSHRAGRCISAIPRFITGRPFLP